MKIILFDSIVDGHHADYASYLAQHLLEQGDEVTFATTAAMFPDRLQQLSPQLSVKRFERASRRFGSNRVAYLLETRASIRQCGLEANAQNADVVHHLFLDGAELAWATAPRARDRSWTTFASRFTLERTVQGERRNLQSRLTATTKHGALKAAMTHERLDGVFVHSERARIALQNILGPSVSKGAVTFVPDPAPPLNDVPRLEARSRLQFPTNRPIFLFFGGLRHNKGPDLLLHALASVPGDWTAVIAGQPLSISEAEIRRSTAALPHPDNVILRLGVIPDEDVDDYFAAADAVVLPYRESYGSIGASSGVLMRATAAGRVIVASDVGDVGPIVRNNRLGFVVPAESSQNLADALTSYLEQREQMTIDVAPRALKYANENSWQVMGAAVRKGYAERLAARHV